jgi:hypothetical protein
VIGERDQASVPRKQCCGNPIKGKAVLSCHFRGKEELRRAHYWSGSKAWQRGRADGTGEIFDHKVMIDYPHNQWHGRDETEEIYGKWTGAGANIAQSASRYVDLAWNRSRIVTSDYGDIPTEPGCKAL